MLIEDYDKPLTLRSPVSRTSSSTSLKEQLSPDLTGDVKIYRKMSPAQPQRRHRPPRDTTGLSASTAKRYSHSHHVAVLWLTLV